MRARRLPYQRERVTEAMAEDHLAPTLLVAAWGAAFAAVAVQAVGPWVVDRYLLSIWHGGQGGQRFLAAP